MPTRCIRVLLKPGTADQVRERFAALAQRRAELLESCERLGLIRERVFLDASSPGGEVLLMVQESDDFAEMSRRFLSSTHPIDEDARAMLADVAVESTVVETLSELDPGRR